MMRLVPRSLFGQTLLVLLTGLVISHLVGSWIYSADREEAVRAVGGLAVADRVTNLVRLVREAPDGWRGRIVTTLSDDTLKVQLSPEPLQSPTADQDPVATEALKQLLIERLSLRNGEDPLVFISRSGCQACGSELGNTGHHAEHGSQMRDVASRVVWKFE